MIEYAGEWTFDTLGLPWEDDFSALADPDGDGLYDLVVVEFLSPSLYLVESPDSAGLPSRLAWADTGFASRYVTVCDLDCDSLLEMGVYHDPHELALYENRGDDRYSLISSGLAGEQMQCFVPDIDRDGRPEWATCWYDQVTFYEAVADDSLAEAFQAHDSMLENPEVLVAGPDIDRDGRTELITFQVNRYNQAKLAVLESCVNDSVQVVWGEVSTGCYALPHGLCLGDIDGDSIPEIGVADGQDVRLYRCIGNDHYEEVWRFPSRPADIGILDINGDGRGEFLHSVEGYETLIWQYVDSVGVAEHEAARLREVEVSPSVLRPGARLRLSGLPANAKVELLDISGRVSFESGSAFILPPSSLSSGAYFVRISSGSQSITRKILVVE